MTNICRQRTGVLRVLYRDFRWAHTWRMGPEYEPEMLRYEPVRSRPPSEPECVQSSTVRAAHPGRWFLMAIVLVAGFGAVVADGNLRAQDDVKIAGCRHDLSIATGYAEGRLGLVSNYLESPVNSNGRVQRLHLADLMSARASEVLPRVQRAERSCRKITLQPWHFSQVERQSESEAYSAALLTLVQTIAAQGRMPFRDDGTMQRLRAVAGAG